MYERIGNYESGAGRNIDSTYLGLFFLNLHFPYSVHRHRCGNVLCDSFFWTTVSSAVFGGGAVQRCPEDRKEASRALMQACGYVAQVLYKTLYQSLS
jgi:hypothetical protein